MAYQEHSIFPPSMVLLVLALLEEGDQYGYQLIERLASHADTTFSMCEGMLYPLLHALEHDGELRSYFAQSENDRPRRYYGLTKQGIHTLSRKRRAQLRSCGKIGKVVGGEACAER